MCCFYLVTVVNNLDFEYNHNIYIFSFLYFQDLQKLQTEVDNVYRSLRYIKAVIDQEKVQIVPNTASVVLDTVNDVFVILNNFSQNHER